MELSFEIGITPDGRYQFTRRDGSRHLPGGGTRDSIGVPPRDSAAADASEVGGARPRRWAWLGLRGVPVDRAPLPTNAKVSEFALRSLFFFCQLSVNEVDGFSADADVHLKSEVYRKWVGVCCQEHREVW